jgi:hypothetical protein
VERSNAQTTQDRNRIGEQVKQREQTQRVANIAASVALASGNAPVAALLGGFAGVLAALPDKPETLRPRAGAVVRRLIGVPASGATLAEIATVSPGLDIFSQYSQSGGGVGGGIPVSTLIQLGGALRQQTAAARMNAFKAAGARGGRTTQRRRKTKASKPRRTVKRRTNSARGKKNRARLVKGSPAAKAYMAKIRRKKK